MHVNAFASKRDVDNTNAKQIQADQQNDPWRHELLRHISDQTFTVGAAVGTGRACKLVFELVFYDATGAWQNGAFGAFLQFFCKSAIANLRPHSLFLWPNMACRASPQCVFRVACDEMKYQPPKTPGV